MFYCYLLGSISVIEGFYHKMDYDNPAQDVKPWNQEHWLLYMLRQKSYSEVKKADKKDPGKLNMLLF